MAGDPSSPSRFAGQPWSVWAEHMGRDCPDSDEDLEWPDPDCMRLPMEDMGLYGQCPEWDPFYTVVCEQCEALVKPQGLSRHMELWHKAQEPSPNTDLVDKAVNKCGVSSKSGAGNKTGAGNVKLKVKKSITATSSQLGPLPSSQESACTGNAITNTDHVLKLLEGENAPISTDTCDGSSQTKFMQARSSSVSPISLQPVVQLTPLPTSSKIASFISILPRLASQLMTNSISSTSGSTLPLTTHATLPVTVRASETVTVPLRPTASPQRKRFKSERKCLPVKDREYDADKHCGVWNEESSKHCTRSLTCKSHSLSMRRAVMGRSKHFDRLLADHRAAKEAAGRAGKVQLPATETDVGKAISSPTNHVGGSSQVDEIPMATLPSSLSATVPFSPDVPTNPPSNILAYSTSLVTPLPSLPDLTIDTFDTQCKRPSKTPVLTTVARFTRSSNHLPRPPEEPPKFLPKLEDVTWVKAHPKPVTVCSFTTRKFGGMVCNNRRVEVFRYGLRTALTQGYIRIPHSNDYYGVPLQSATNHATSAMKTVLTNISTRGHLLSASSKLLVPNCSSSKSHHSNVIGTATRKINQTSAALPTSIASSCNLKTVLPKPPLVAAKTTVNHNSNATEGNLKSGHFHIPNILSSSLKKPLETYRSNTGVSLKRCKRKNNINAAEVLSSLLGRKNHLSGTLNPVPIVAVAVPNGVSIGNPSSSQIEGGETKSQSLFPSRSVPDSLLTELPKTITPNNVAVLPESSSNTSNVKVSQNLRIAAAPSTVQVATPQITYLTTGPVTFQQIPVLSSQVINQIQLQSKSGSNPTVKLLSQSSGVARTMVVHPDVEHSSNES